jgi:hypothetical protein
MLTASARAWGGRTFRHRARRKVAGAGRPTGLLPGRGVLDMDPVSLMLAGRRARRRRLRRSCQRRPLASASAVCRPSQLTSQLTRPPWRRARAAPPSPTYRRLRTVHIHTRACSSPAAGWCTGSPRQACRTVSVSAQITTVLQFIGRCRRSDFCALTASSPTYFCAHTASRRSDCVKLNRRQSREN